MEGGCFVPVSHRLNGDGYFRKTWSVEGTKEREFFHRFIYRAANDLPSIPEGVEIDHKCGNRACQNPHHLRLLTRHDHSVTTNHHRSLERFHKARAYWQETNCSGAHLSREFNVSDSTTSRWIRNRFEHPGRTKVKPK
jgi:hypothetical protein